MFTDARVRSAEVLPKEVLSSPHLGICFETQAPPTHPLEPILFPKLRIYFADFPYLHYSID